MHISFFKLSLENIYEREWIEPFGIYDPSGELPPIPYGPAKGFFINKYIFGFNIGYFEMSWIICSENKSSVDQKHEIIQRFLHDYDKNIRDIVYTKKEADGALELFLDKEKMCQIKDEKDFLKGYQHGILASQAIAIELSESEGLEDMPLIYLDYYQQIKDTIEHIKEDLEKNTKENEERTSHRKIASLSGDWPHIVIVTIINYMIENWWYFRGY